MTKANHSYTGVGEWIKFVDLGYRRCVAQLVSDTRTLPERRGVTGKLRSEGATLATARSFQLLYNLDDSTIEIDLQLRSALNDDHYTLIGQVLGGISEERRVELVPRSFRPSVEVRADEAFTFRFPKVLPGEYKLRIYGDQQLIEIDLLTV